MNFDNALFLDDCFNVFPKIKNNSVDMVLVDLPYGQTNLSWDIPIDLENMWDNLTRICVENCIYVFFTTTKYGYELIKSKPSYFRYDLVWEKTNPVGFLSANKMPLRNHEMIYIFGKPNSDDIHVQRNKDLREYANKLLNYIGKPYNEIRKDRGNDTLDHFLNRIKTTQFYRPSRDAYDFLISRYKIDEMDGFISYDDLKEEKKPRAVYNARKTEGKAYSHKEEITLEGIYGKYIRKSTINTGYRHPKSVLKFKRDSERLHSTQKPVELCKWLIESYSNEGDTILDFCMGSGSTIIASINTNRKYIGIEKDEDIFNIALKRINDHRDNK